MRDAVDVTLFFYDHADVSGLFNCGTGVARSWNDLVRAVFVAMGRAPLIQYIDMPEGLRAKYQYSTRADITKLRDAGYDRATTGLEDGVREYVTNHLMLRG